MKVLILGVTGMLGSTVFKYLHLSGQHEVAGTARSLDYKKYFSADLSAKVIPDVDVLNQKRLIEVITMSKPDVIINCVGLIKQLPGAYDPLESIPSNTLLPHRLCLLAVKMKARLIHISTDCVFSGKKGLYLETDKPDAEDLYGKSKLMGEIDDLKNAITLRTSIIGHELQSKRSLIDWFLFQENQVKGYKNMIFSGLPTVEMAKVIADYVIPNANLSGLYHVSAEPINKYELLKLVAKVYQKDIEIIPDGEVKIDRSLISDKFSKASGYKAPGWPELINKMYQDRIETNHVS